MRIRVAIGPYSILEIETAKKRNGDIFNYYNSVIGQPFPVIMKQEPLRKDTDEPVPNEDIKELAKKISKEVAIDVSTIEYILKLATDLGDEK